jgi:diguanylate cyclase (GGDEF)-like protein/PAS domain S-box-containing protein
MLGILLVAALAATVVPLATLPSGYFFSGSIAVLLIVRLYDPRWGLCAALLAGGCTLVLWGHPIALLLLIAEVLVVGMLCRRGMRNILLADVIFWVFFGLPLLWLIHGVFLQARPDAVLSAISSQGGNGILNALIATLLLRLKPLRRRLNHPPVSLWETQFNQVLACFLLPVILTILLHLDGPHDLFNADMESELVEECVVVGNLLSSQQRRVESVLGELAQYAAETGVAPSRALQQKVERIRATFSALLRIQVVDSSGNTAAYASVTGEIPEVKGATVPVGTTGQRSPEPLVSAVRSDPLLPIPHLLWRVPILDKDRLTGYVLGAFDIRAIRQLLEELPRRNPFTVTVLDPEGKVVASSDPNRSAMEDFSPHRKEGILSFTDTAYLWQPREKTFTVLSNWQRLWSRKPPLDESPPWGIAMEIPAVIHRAYLQRTVGTSLAIMLTPAVLALFLLRNAGRRMVAPLKELTEVTRDLPQKLEDGKSIVWPELKNEELVSLTRNFRDLAAALENKYQKTREVNEVSGEVLDEVMAQRNWEVFTAGRKLRVEMDRRKRIEGLLSQLEAAESKYRFLVEKTLVGVYFLTGDRLSYINPRFADIFGYQLKELAQDSRLIDLVVHEDKVLVSGNLRRQALGEVNNLQYQFRGVKKDGSVIHVEVLSGKGSYEGQMAILGTLLDVTARVKAEETIEHLAYHDPLTGLPNRLLFADRVNQALAFAERNQLMVGMLFLDLDRFKTVNDTLGHAAGDQLLKTMAQRLHECLRESDSVSRFGGDEFNILVTQIKQESDVSLVAHKILRAMRFPFNIEEHEIFLTCSIGIALFPRDCRDVQGLMKNADTALYRAKDLGRNNYQIYSPSMNARALERMAMESSLRRVLERNELRVHYQAQVSLETGRIIGMEALVRWEHAIGEMIQPSVFIPLAEEIGLIGPIGEWVLRTACHQAKRWQREGFEPLRVGVNVSAKQLQDPKFAEVVAHIVSESKVDPQWINLEITESVVMEDVKEAIGKFCQLHDVGITVAIDDFGIGYSSLSYLKDFPVDQLKMDRSFVQNLPHEANDANIARHIIAMAHEVGLTVIAEGVETEEQFEFLRSLGCDEVQGFLLSKPLPPEEFVRLLQGEKTFAFVSQDSPPPPS